MENALYWLVVILCLFVTFMDITFLSSLAVLLFSKKVKAKFLFARCYDDSYRKFACYEFEGKRYRNIFPAQGDPKGKIYPKEKMVDIRIIRRFSLALDKLTVITIVVGTVSSAALSVFMYFLLRFIDSFA